MRVKVYNNRLKVYGNRVKYNYPNESKGVVDGIQTTDLLNAAQRLYAHFIVGMEINESIWTKNRALYGMVGGTAAAHKWNWKDMRNLDDAFRLTYSGGVVHNINGFNGNGTTGYADTKLSPNAIITGENINVSMFTNSTQYDVNDCFGAYRAGEPSLRFIIRASGLIGIASGYSSASNNDRIDLPAVLIKGFYSINTQPIKININGDLKSTITSAYGIVGKSTRNITIGAIGENNPSSQYSNRNFGFFSIGEGITDVQSTQMSQIVNFAQKMRANF